MSEELHDEVTSINSICGASTLLPLSSEPAIIYALTFPSQPAIALRIEFPERYPDAPPSILGTQTVGDDAAKGDGAFLVELVREVLGDVYIPGAPCIFDLVEEVGAKLQQLGLDHTGENSGEEIKAQGVAEADGSPLDRRGLEASMWSSRSDRQQQHEDEDDSLGDLSPWSLSDVVTEKKSVFVARAAPVTSVAEAQRRLSHLLATEKKVARATHNITAWRIRGANGVQYQDCDDDGETAAGGRLLHLLELMGVWEAMVVVTRWYGGVQLGPDRFRIINQTAREALVRGGLDTDADQEGSKKKGKK